MNPTQIPHAQLEISRSAILHNYKYYKSLLEPTTKMLVVVKANSYGHGASDFAKLLEDAGVDYLGVATPIEGIRLREDGIRLPILVLTTGVENYSDMIEYNLEPALPTLEALEDFCEDLKKHNLSNYPIHIPVDTGMHRIGFMMKEIPALCNAIKEKGDLVKIASIYSHLVAADEYIHDDFTLKQIILYKEMYGMISSSIGYKAIRHILNTAGIERFTQYQMDMVRLGLGIYGISVNNQSALRATTHFKVPIIQIKELSPSDGTVGYSRRGLIKRDNQRIATICIGYADGFNRHFGNGKASFMVNGKMAPTIGNICMDMSMIDITGIEAKVGDPVTIFGDTPSASDLAGILDTIPYEIFTSIDSRVKRVYVD